MSISNTCAWCIVGSLTRPSPQNVRYWGFSVVNSLDEVSNFKLEALRVYSLPGIPSPPVAHSLACIVNERVSDPQVTWSSSLGISFHNEFLLQV